METLTVIETHPIQYHAPLYRTLQRNFGIPVTVIYGSDFSISGYHDKEFNSVFSWDRDLLSGYKSIFLSRVSKDGMRISTRGIGRALESTRPKVVMLVGYSGYFHQTAFWETLKRKYPIIFRSETTDHAKRRSWIRDWMRDNALRFIYQKCAKLLYIGKHSYDHFKCIGIPEEKLIFSPYCVDTTLFKCDTKSHNNLRSFTRKNLGIAENNIAILFSRGISDANH